MTRRSRLPLLLRYGPFDADGVYVNNSRLDECHGADLGDGLGYRYGAAQGPSSRRRAVGSYLGGSE